MHVYVVHEPSTSSRSHCSFNWNQPPTRLFVRSCLDSLQTQGWQTAANTTTSSTSSASGSLRGTVTQRWSVPHDAQRILNCLHVMSWFSFGAQSLRRRDRLGRPARMRVRRCDLRCGVQRLLVHGLGDGTHSGKCRRVWVDMMMNPLHIACGTCTS